MAELKKETNKKEKEYKDRLKAGAASASAEVVQRYGAAAKEHLVAYSGIDNEAGKVLKKGLKSISEEKINPDYEFQNIHQQAGFSAEVKDVARTNADNIIKKNSTRKVRTDDLGSVNDPLYDTVIVDSSGKVIDGTGTQLKFVGASKKDPLGTGDAERALNKLKSKRFQKYLDADAKIKVPSDQYEDILKEADKEIEKLQKQLKANADDPAKATQIQEKINCLIKIKKNLRKSNVSSKEAVEARMDPKLSTAKDVVKISHKAGVQTAISSGVISGSVSIVKNLVSFSKGEIEAKDAAENVAKDTLSTTAVGYATGFTGAALKGAMQNSSSQYVRALSKTNVAGTVVAATVSATGTLKSYLYGEIDGAQCLETLGEQQTGMLASAMFAAVGQAAIPIPVVGGLIGGMLGYSLSSATYGILVQSLKDEKMSKQQRNETEKACNEYIRMIQSYRKEIEEIMNQYLADESEVFQESFRNIKDALAIGDVDWFIESANRMTEHLGGEVPFSDMEDFNAKMTSGSTFKL